MRTVVVGFSVDDTAESLRAMLRLIRSEGGAHFDLGTPEFSDDVRIDLTDCQFLGPMAVVALCALRRAAIRQKRVVEILLPNLERLNAYCRYSGLLAEFGLGASPDASHPENVTRPVHRFSMNIPLAEIEAITVLAKQKMHLSEAGESDLKLTLSEVTQNVLDHSVSAIGGIMSARAYSKKREVRFAVADLGVGFRGALTNAGISVESDCDALRQVFIEKRSSRSQLHNMGQGLQHLHHIVRLTGGRLVVYSRGAYLEYRKKDKFISADVPFPGTIVFVRLPIRDDDADQSPKQSFWDE